MLKPFSKVIITITILIALLGQASAYSFMPIIETASDHTQNSQTSNSSLIASDNIDAETNDDCCDLDCCESDCICPANACAAFIFLSNFGYSQPMMRFTESITHQYLNIPFNIAESLYRPPIFISLG